MKPGSSQSVQVAEYDPKALYIWVDEAGVVLDGVAGVEIGEPLFHAGIVKVVPPSTPPTPSPQPFAM